MNKAISRWVVFLSVFCVVASADPAPVDSIGNFSHKTSTRIAGKISRENGLLGLDIDDQDFHLEAAFEDILLFGGVDCGLEAGEVFVLAASKGDKKYKVRPVRKNHVEFKESSIPRKYSVGTADCVAGILLFRSDTANLNAPVDQRAYAAFSVYSLKPVVGKLPFSECGVNFCRKVSPKGDLRQFIFREGPFKVMGVSPEGKSDIQGYFWVGNVVVKVRKAGKKYDYILSRPFVESAAVEETYEEIFSLEAPSFMASGPEQTSEDAQKRNFIIAVRFGGRVDLYEDGVGFARVANMDRARELIRDLVSDNRKLAILTSESSIYKANRRISEEVGELLDGRNLDKSSIGFFEMSELKEIKALCETLIEAPWFSASGECGKVDFAMDEKEALEEKGQWSKRYGHRKDRQLAEVIHVSQSPRETEFAKEREALGSIFKRYDAKIRSSAYIQTQLEGNGDFIQKRVSTFKPWKVN